MTPCGYTHSGAPGVLCVAREAGNVATNNHTRGHSDLMTPLSGGGDFYVIDTVNENIEVK